MAYIQLPNQNKLSGLNTLAYMGTEAATPPQFVIEKRDPTANDYQGWLLGTLWLNKPTNALWALVNKVGNVSTWIPLYPNAAAIQFTSDNGIALPLASNINVLGGTNMHTEALAPGGDTITANLIDNPVLAGGLTITPLAAVGVVTTDAAGLLNSTNGLDGQIFVARPVGPSWVDLVSADASVIITESVDPLHPLGIDLKAVGGGGGAATKLEGDDTLVVTQDIVTNIIKVLGDDTIKTYRSALDTLVIGIEDSPNNGDIMIGGGPGVATAWATLTSSGGSVTITNPGPNQINLEAAGVAALTGLTGDVGAAAPVAGLIKIAGGAPLTTSAAGSTVTINAGAPNLDGRVMISSAGGPATWRQLSAGANVTITESNDGAGRITISASGGGATGGIQQLDCDSGVAVNPITNIVKLEGHHGTYNIDHVTHPYQNIFTRSELATPDLVTLQLTSSIQLPITNAGGTAGVIMLGTKDFMHAYGTNNTFLGQTAGNRTLTVATAHDNVGIGKNALHGLTKGTQNVAIGSGAIDVAPTASNCVAIGYNALGGGVSSSCIAIGAGAGSVGIGSNDIHIGHVGVAGESGVIRIGTPATHTDTYLAGVYLETGAASPGVVYVDPNSKLGSTAAGTSNLHILGCDGNTPEFVRLTSTDSSINITRGATTINLGQGTAYSFIAYVGTPRNNVTGDGTEYFLGTGNNAIYKLTEEYDDGGNFYPGDGFAVPAKYTAPYAGIYFFNMSVMSWYTIPPPPPPPSPPVNIDPVYIRIYNAANVNYKTYELTYPLFSLIPMIQNAQFMAYVKMAANDYAQFSFSVLLDPSSKIVGIGQGIGNSYVSGQLISRI